MKASESIPEVGSSIITTYYFIRLTLWVIFKDKLHNKPGLTWAWPAVLHMASLIQILNRKVWPKHVSLVTADEWEEAFFWPIAVSNLCCETQRLKRLTRGGRPKGRLWSNVVRLKGQCHEIFASGIFYESVSPQPPVSLTPVANLPPVSLIPVVNL